MYLSPLRLGLPQPFLYHLFGLTTRMVLMLDKAMVCFEHSVLTSRPCIRTVPPLSSNLRRRVVCKVDQQPTAAPAAAPVSLGVPITSYDISGALAAVSGKSFACTMCGKCCTLQDDAEVWVSSAEVKAMAQYLQISTAAFQDKYCQPYDGVPGWRLLQSKLVDMPQQQSAPNASAVDVQQQTLAAGKHSPHQQQVCALLNDDKSCSVYPVRPIQCSTYPWWPELMPPQNWVAEKEYMCEGFDHAEAAPLDKWYAAQQLQKATQHTLALEAAKPPGWDAGQQLYPEEQSKS